MSKIHYSSFDRKGEYKIIVDFKPMSKLKIGGSHEIRLVESENGTYFEKKVDNIYSAYMEYMAGKIGKIVAPYSPTINFEIKSNGQCSIFSEKLHANVLNLKAFCESRVKKRKQIPDKPIVGLEEAIIFKWLIGDPDTKLENFAVIVLNDKYIVYPIDFEWGFAKSDPNNSAPSIPQTNDDILSRITEFSTTTSSKRILAYRQYLSHDLKIGKSYNMLQKAVKKENEILNVFNLKSSDIEHMQSTASYNEEEEKLEASDLTQFHTFMKQQLQRVITSLCFNNHNAQIQHKHKRKAVEPESPILKRKKVQEGGHHVSILEQEEAFCLYKC